MANRRTRSVGVLLLGFWLILAGLQAFGPCPSPGSQRVVSLIAGVSVIVGCEPE